MQCPLLRWILTDISAWTIVLVVARRANQRDLRCHVVLTHQRIFPIHFLWVWCGSKEVGIFCHVWCFREGRWRIEEILCRSDRHRISIFLLLKCRIHNLPIYKIRLSLPPSQIDIECEERLNALWSCLALAAFHNVLGPSDDEIVDDGLVSLEVSFSVEVV